MIVALLLRLAHVILFTYLMLRVVKKLKSPLSQVNLPGLKQFFSSYKPFYITAIFSALQIQLPTVFLQMNSSAVEVSYFSLSNKILGPFQMLLFTILQTSYPYFVRLADNSSESFYFEMQKYLRFFLCLCVSLASIFSLLSKEIVLFVYGTEFISSVGVIELHVWYFVYLVVFSLLGLSLSSLNLEHGLSKLAISYGLISIFLTYIFSFYGARQLSMSYLLCATLAFSYHIFYIHKWTDSGFKMTTLLSTFIVLIIFPYGLPLLMFHSDISFIIRICISTLIFLFSILISIRMFRSSKVSFV